MASVTPLETGLDVPYGTRRAIKEGGTTEASLTDFAEALLLSLRLAARCFRSHSSGLLRRLHAGVQLARIKRLTTAADAVQRQRQLPHHSDDRRLALATTLRFLLHIPTPHGLLP
jgi:hypothetical protein